MKFQSAMTCTSLLLMGATFVHGKAIRGGGATETATAAQQRQLQDAITVFAFDDLYTLEEGDDLNVRRQDGPLDNDVSNADLTITSTQLLGTFRGSLSVETDGEFSYSPPNDDFVGTDFFSYRVCSDDLTVCDDATVTIRVEADPNKPNVAPVAEDNEYRVREGESIDRNVLDNDRQGTPSNPLFVCESRNEDNIEDRDGGDFDFDTDGDLDYTAPRCFTGTRDFFYRACYEDYEDMISNEGRVRIIVDSGRPNVPSPSNDRYEVLEGEELDINEDDGLLRNDDCTDEDCFVENTSENSGFQGDLDVDSDGSFDYTYVPGQLGTFSFRYTICEDGWEDCVACRDATVEIVVKENPDKPDAPTFDNIRFTIEAGDLLNEDLVAQSNNYDDRYTLEFSNFNQEGTFGGSLDGDDDGTFEYGQSSAGEDTFSFTACYEEWPDLCTNAQATVETLASTSESASRLDRQGLATFYEVNWSGESQGSDCGVVPTITMSCNGAGSLSFVELVAAESSFNSNANCQTQNVTAQDGSMTTNIVCSGQTAGTVSVSCFDFMALDQTNRALSVVAQSAPVTCDTGSIGSNALNTISQSVGLKTVCSNALVTGGLTCSGTSLNDAAGNPVLCYETVASLDGTATAPADITLTSSPNFDLCVGTASDLVIGPPTLAFIGDADGEEGVPGYPLQECQADCDDDDECAGDLICFHRDGDVIPGCVGVAEEDRDYCVKPPQVLVVSRNGAGSFP